MIKQNETHHANGRDAAQLGSAQRGAPRDRRIRIRIDQSSRNDAYIGVADGERFTLAYCEFRRPEATHRRRGQQTMTTAPRPRWDGSEEKRRRQTEKTKSILI